MKVREILGVLFQDGWYIFSQKGSHMQLKHPEKIGRVTVPNHGLGKEVDIKTEKSILKQAGIGDKET
ncbi:type II toxin-antitoxin system HicA family toxin [Leptospira mtsangambouensis]|nr:type II toxin-antitoxin system HicA family toxin [Leptospira mtsangambouensis]MCG6140323.1 type II toxin-antitoxin system HicA family toxin [Leptospira mtsangambouensis]